MLVALWLPNMTSQNISEGRRMMGNDVNLKMDVALVFSARGLEAFKVDV